MRKRTQSREFALQVLYQVDITGEKCEDSLKSFWVNLAEEPGQEIKEFAEQLACGTTGSLAEIDKKISDCAVNWKLERMAVIDRNILRLGCYELLFRTDIPPKVAINEAVELAKKFSCPEAGKFVNGILDKIKSEKK